MGREGDPKALRLSCLVPVVVLLFTNCFINERGFLLFTTHACVKKRRKKNPLQADRASAVLLLLTQ